MGTGYNCFINVGIVGGVCSGDGGITVLRQGRTACTFRASCFNAHLSRVMGDGDNRVILMTFTLMEHGMYYPVCRMVHIEDSLLLAGKNNPCGGGSGFPLLLSE